MIHLLVAAIITAAAPCLFFSPAGELAIPTRLYHLFLFTCCSQGLLIGVVPAAAALHSLVPVNLPAFHDAERDDGRQICCQHVCKNRSLLPASYVMQSLLGLSYGREALYNQLWESWYYYRCYSAPVLAVYLFNWTAKTIPGAVTGLTAPGSAAVSAGALFWCKICPAKRI